MTPPPDFSFLFHVAGKTPEEAKTAWDGLNKTACSDFLTWLVKSSGLSKKELNKLEAVLNGIIHLRRKPPRRGGADECKGGPPESRQWREKEGASADFAEGMKDITGLARGGFIKKEIPGENYSPSPNTSKLASRMKARGEPLRSLGEGGLASEEFRFDTSRQSCEELHLEAVLGVLDKKKKSAAIDKLAEVFAENLRKTWENLKETADVGKKSALENYLKTRYGRTNF
ncbi:MAG: hypothetical protein Q8N98_01425 [bacterium]|nr:hypothetical protein [bacterium]